MRMCMCIYIYMHICIYTHVCMYVYMYRYIYIYTYIDTCIYLCVGCCFCESDTRCAVLRPGLVLDREITYMYIYIYICYDSLSYYSAVE